MSNSLSKLYACIVLLLSVCSGFAQTRTVSGTIFNSKGDPVPLATVQQKGTSRFTTSSDRGQFAISIQGANPILVISSTGFETKEITIGTADAYPVTLTEASGVLQEVVVTTAFGLKQKKKALGYNVQELTSSQLDKGKENNFIGALQGKVSNVNITSTGGAAGSGTDILIRGMSSLNPAANNQPLIIIDGMPVNNNTVVGRVIPSAGSNALQAGSNDQFGYANRGLDINPDDIETLSVLKGAGATALYGLQAANGVLIITTKKGREGKTTIQVNSSISSDFLTKYPEIQTSYREGSNGRVAVNTDGSLGSKFQTFGPPITASDQVFYNFRDAFETGHRYNNFVSLQGGSNKASYYSSFSALNQDGILKYTGFDRYTFKLQGAYQVSPKLSVSASGTLTNSKTVAPSAGDKGVMTSLSYHTTTLDVRDYMYPDGSMKVYSPGTIDNPLYVARFSQLKSNLFRIVGNMGLNWAITPKLRFDFKAGGDFYGDTRTRIVPGPRYPGDPTTLDMAIANGGYMVEERVTFRNVTANTFLTWQDQIGSDFDYSILVGSNLEVTYTDILNARGERFALPGFYDLSNTTNLYNFRSTSNRRYAGIFANAKLSYKNALFLELTGRNDWSSTLPDENNSFFYPSASLSYVFTEIPKLAGDILSFGKIRLSYAEVGKDAPIYSVGSYFASVPGFPFVSGATNIPGFLQSNTYGDPKLKPERQKSFEIGTELRFLKNRISVDLTYYNSKNEDQIIPIPISYTSGYSRFVTNAGTIQNSGFEVELGADPIKTKDFLWNFMINWSRNISEVKAIKEGISEIAFYDEGRVVNKLVVGGSAADLYGTAYLRNDQGQLLIKADGFPDYTKTFVKVGNALPDWMGSINNTFTYKNLSLSFLLEYKQGGDMMDVTMRNSIRNGVLKITENRYEQVVFGGVKISDGKPNDIPVVLDHNYYRNTNFFNNITDIIVQDASWLRLRNVNLNYTLPAKTLSKVKWIKGVSAGITGSNFLLWTPYSGYDPGSTAFSSGYNVYGFTGSSIPNYSSVIFNLNLTF